MSQINANPRRGEKNDNCYQAGISRSFQAGFSERIFPYVLKRTCLTNTPFDQFMGLDFRRPTFEIKPSPEKQLGMFAIENIAPGTEIFREDAILKGPKEWLAKEALFMVLPEDKKTRFTQLHGAV